MNISNMSVHMAILWKFLGTIRTYKRFFACMNENMFLHCFLFRWKFGAYWTGEFLRPKFNWHQILQWIKTKKSNFSISFFFVKMQIILLMIFSNMSVHMAILWKFLGTIWTFKRSFSCMRKNMCLHYISSLGNFWTYRTGKFLRSKFDWKWNILQ